MQWYYAVGDQRHGPVEQAEFERLVSTGAIRSDTLVWRQGMANWQAYASTVGSGASAGPAPTLPMTQPFPAAAAATTPVAAAMPGPYGYGGFWPRFVARFLDGLILMVVMMFIGGMLGAAFGLAGALRSGHTVALILLQIVIQIINVMVALAYDVYFIRRSDATPGKMALGLKVLRADGTKLSVGRIIGRNFATLISALPLFIGYIVAAFDDQKRTFHDRICDTRVIKAN